MCKVSDKSEMVGEIIEWFDMELTLHDLNFYFDNLYAFNQVYILTDNYI